VVTSSFFQLQSGINQRATNDLLATTDRLISRQGPVIPQGYKDYALMSSISNVIEPISFDKASEHDEWKNAMEEKYESIRKNNTWELTELPKHKKSHWMQMDIQTEI
jgi:hypothetical protein